MVIHHRLYHPSRGVCRTHASKFVSRFHGVATFSHLVKKTQCNGIRLFLLSRIKCMLAYLLGVSIRQEEPNYSGDCRLDLPTSKAGKYHKKRETDPDPVGVSFDWKDFSLRDCRGKDRVHAETPQWHISRQQPRPLVVRVWHTSCNAVIGHDSFTILSPTRSAPCVSGLESQKS